VGCPARSWKKRSWIENWPFSIGKIMVSITGCTPLDGLFHGTSKQVHGWYYEYTGPYGTPLDNWVLQIHPNLGQCDMGCDGETCENTSHAAILLVWRWEDGIHWTKYRRFEGIFQEPRLEVLNLSKACVRPEFQGMSLSLSFGASLRPLHHAWFYTWVGNLKTSPKKRPVNF
jgi:hypothetical protein